MNRVLKYLLVAEGFWMLAAGLFGPIYAIFVTKVGGDVLEAGGAYAAFSLSAGIMVFIISRWEDHVRHKEKLIVIGHVVGAVSILGYLFVSSPIHLFIVQMMLGVAEAISSPAFDGIYSRNLDRGRFASEWGLYDSMDYLVAGVSAGVGGLIASVFGFQTLFLIMFLLSLVSIAVSVKLYYLNR
jgi:predicted MFS family arabinose efflux permease